MANAHGDGVSEGVTTTPTDETLAWIRHHWLWVVGAVLLLLILWRASGRTPDENGRYLLVKDDVPCQSARSGDEGRRWCYVVLDTRTGKLEERVRKIGKRR